MTTEFTLVPVIDEGLGNSTYLLDLGDGRALVLDPERDLREVRAEARRRGLRIAYAVETHLHADFISGVRELADVDGATALAPEVGPRGFAVTELTDGDTIDLGAFRLEALATPGHSPEHLSYLLRRGDQLLGVFTGGSLMVGTAGRTDLVSPEQTVPLARAQYHSLQRLMELPDETPIWPTHGAGSFCSSALGGDRVSTIGRERATNPLLQVAGEEEFVDALLGSLGTFPDYFLRLGEINERGPAVLGGTVELAALTDTEVRDLIADGAQVVDARPAADFADGHIPGALSITLRPVFATWLGWLADPDRPLVIVRGNDQKPEDIASEAAKVGFDTLAGELAGGMAAWTGPVNSAALLDAEHLDTDVPATVLDVRQAAEFATGHVPGARNVELGALQEQLAQVPPSPVVVMCGHGERAMGAASVLERAGHTDIRVLDGGPLDHARAHGQQLQVEQ
ncbi:MBL fold metallo-hydrolase [Amycolatopsis magusensis]|uniref:Glyoxylase-like metal-dependent hydrolase (Beta-lactamase superfamily II) n=1 Tax=Amycolatopsis magusensis TaxID=882444 RepID=A0ABS4PZ03_9PSEU|nr:MBL fold metallo-hydrolase [Amycolatopsis magusensis]MBP2183791.1 glyoxylase-like metal-dependent hydrolase (beta-lactamase superfamily II) [Amycolatopsis magusensis]